MTGPVAVSPDERRFAYLSGGPDKRSSIIVAGPNPADRQTILTRSEPDFLRYQLSWSPDAALLAVPIGSTDDRFWQIERVLIVPVNGTAPAILAPVKWSVVSERGVASERPGTPGERRRPEPPLFRSGSCRIPAANPGG